MVPPKAEGQRLGNLADFRGPELVEINALEGLLAWLQSNQAVALELSKAPELGRCQMGGLFPVLACSTRWVERCQAGQVQTAMAELVAKGHAEGKLTLSQWSDDTGSRAFLEDPKFVVVGVGRSMSSADSAIWTLDIASLDDASCEPGGE